MPGLSLNLTLSAVSMPELYTDRLWANERIAGIVKAILAHPFITGLADGSLDESRFRCM